MRPPVDAERVRALARELSHAVRRSTTLYLTGGATVERWGSFQATRPEEQIRGQREAQSGDPVRAAGVLQVAIARGRRMVFLASQVSQNADGELPRLFVEDHLVELDATAVID